MAYYDHLVANPEAALDEAADRRGYSREAMAARLEAIRGMSIGLGHLTLSQAQIFFDENPPPSQDLVAHVEQCGYCTALLNGLEATAVEESLTTVLERLNTVPEKTVREAAELIHEPAIKIRRPASTRSPGGRSGWRISDAVLVTAAGSFFLAVIFFNGSGQTDIPIAATTETGTDNVSVPLDYENPQLQNTVGQASFQDRIAVSPIADIPTQSEWSVVYSNDSTVTLQRSTNADSPSLAPGDNVLIINSAAFERVVPREMANDL